MIPDELDTLRMAASRNDRIGIMTSIERLDEAFDRDGFGSQRFDTMAALLDRRSDDSPDEDVSEGYREAVIELEQRRIELDRSTLAYVRGEDSSTTLIDSIDAVDAAYREYDESTVALKATVSDVSTAPILVVSGTPDIEIPKGTTIGAELALSSVGRSHPDPIAVRVESEVSANVSPRTIEDLSEDETIPLQIELSPSTAGEFDVFVTATGETTADRVGFVIYVLTKRDYVQKAGQAARSLETILVPMGGRGNGSSNQARTLRRRLESISDDLENRRHPIRSIDNRLNAVQNTVESMKRRIASSESSVERQEALYILESISEQIDDAIEALP